MRGREIAVCGLLLSGGCAEDGSSRVLLGVELSQGATFYADLELFSADEPEEEGDPYATGRVQIEMAPADEAADAVDILACAERCTDVVGEVTGEGVCRSGFDGGDEITNTIDVTPGALWPAPGVQIIVDGAVDIGGNAAPGQVFELGVPAPPDSALDPSFEQVMNETPPDWFAAGCKAEEDPDATGGGQILSCPGPAAVWGYFPELTGGDVVSVDVGVFDDGDGEPPLLSQAAPSLLTTAGERVDAEIADAEMLTPGNDSWTGFHRLTVTAPAGAPTGVWLEVRMDSGASWNSYPYLNDRVVAPVP